MAKGRVEAPETLAGLIQHPEIANLTRADILKSGGVFDTKPGASVVLGAYPNSEAFWMPDRVNGSASAVRTLIALASNGEVRALAFTDSDRQVIFTSTGIVERRGWMRKTDYEPHTNAVSEWDEQGQIVRFEIVHELPANNGQKPQSANVVYLSNFDSEDPALVRESQQVFSPARSIPTISINGLLNSVSHELRPNFNLTGRPNQLDIRIGISTNLRWDVNITEQVREVWEVGGFDYSFNKEGDKYKNP